MFNILLLNSELVVVVMRLFSFLVLVVIIILLTDVTEYKIHLLTSLYAKKYNYTHLYLVNDSNCLHISEHS